MAYAEWIPFKIWSNKTEYLWVNLKEELKALCINILKYDTIKRWRNLMINSIHRLEE